MSELIEPGEALRKTARLLGSRDRAIDLMLDYLRGGIIRAYAIYVNGTMPEHASIEHLLNSSKVGQYEFDGRSYVEVPRGMFAAADIGSRISWSAGSISMPGKGGATLSVAAADQRAVAGLMFDTESWFGMLNEEASEAEWERARADFESRAGAESNAEVAQDCPSPHEPAPSKYTRKNLLRAGKTGPAAEPYVKVLIDYFDHLSRPDGPGIDGKALDDMVIEVGKICERKDVSAPGRSRIGEYRERWRQSDCPETIPELAPKSGN